MRNLGGSVGVSVVTTELQWRSQFHHARLAEHVGLRWLGLRLDAGGDRAPAPTQATMLSYLDVFIVLTFAGSWRRRWCYFSPTLPGNSCWWALG